MSLSGSGTCVCAWWTKGRTNLAFIGEQNFWRSSPSIHYVPAWQVRVFYARTPSNCLLTSDVNSDVVAIAFIYCLFDFAIRSALFFRQTTQTIHISLWNYNSECYIIADCCCWPAFFCLRLTLPTLKCPCLFAYSLISWKNLTPWMNRINELGWVSFHTFVHFFSLLN